MSKNVIVLGMSNALAVKLNYYGEPEVIQDHSEGADKIECAVISDNDSAGHPFLVGRAARIEGIFYPDELKSFFSDGASEDSETCLTALFQYILEIARASGEDFSEAAICCPSYFKQGVICNAANAAGICTYVDHLRFINEQEAVLASCRRDTALQHESVLVCDLGGSRLDVYLLQIDDLSNAIKEGFSDNSLGGRQWTDCMKQLLLDKIVEETGFAIDELDNETLCEIGYEAERIKAHLSFNGTRKMRIRIYNEPYRLMVDRKEFEEYAEEYVKALRLRITSFIEEACWEFNQILLLGGASRMPIVRATMEKAFPGKKIISGGDFTVAYGAAFVANSQDS